MSNKVARRRQPKKGKGKPNADITLHPDFIDKTPAIDAETGKTVAGRMSDVRVTSMPAIEDKRKRYVSASLDLQYANQPAFDKELEKLADEQGKREALDRARNAEAAEAAEQAETILNDVAFRATLMGAVVERIPDVAQHDLIDDIEEHIKSTNTELDDGIKDVASQPASRHARENDREKRHTIVQKSLDRQIEDHRRKAQKQFEEENK